MNLRQSLRSLHISLGAQRLLGIVDYGHNRFLSVEISDAVGPVPMLSILVVDDEASVLHLLRLVLEGAGHKVSEASGGKKALEEVHQKTFDLVVADLLMPVYESFETICALKREHAGLRIIATAEGFRDLIGVHT